VGPFVLAVVQAHLGESKEMYASLERAYTIHSRDLTYSLLG
jgi:hypothetical protein